MHVYTGFIYISFYFQRKGKKKPIIIKLYFKTISRNDFLNLPYLSSKYFIKLVCHSKDLRIQETFCAVQNWIGTLAF